MSDGFQFIANGDLDDIIVPAHRHQYTDKMNWLEGKERKPLVKFLRNVLTRNSSTSAILIPKRTFSLDYPDDWE
jgi:hypothetical protein